MDLDEEIDKIKAGQTRTAQKIKELAASVSYRVMSPLGSHVKLQ